jgi:hypothetical protein
MWGLLNQTIRSICANTGDFKIFIAANKVLPFESDIDTEKIELLEVKSEPIEYSQPKQLGPGFLAHNYDKAVKRIALIDEAKQHGPTYYYMMDADDLISNRTVSFLSTQTATAIIVDKGYFYKTQEGTVCEKEQFNIHCGTSVAVKASYVHENVDDWVWSVEWLGRHKCQRNHRDVEFVPFPASVYCLHSDCTSRYLYKRLGDYRDPTPEEIEEFKLPVISD